MKKKIIGYRLIKPEVKSAATHIAGFKSTANFTTHMETTSSGVYVSRLKEAGVLDLWFEPIYKEEVELKIGDWIYFMEGSKCGRGIGDVVRINNIGGSTDDVWIHHTPSSFSGGGFRWHKDAYELDRDFRLATAKEIIAYLTSEALKRYPDGTTVNQETAYNGLGSVCKTKGTHVSCGPTGTGYKFINVSIGDVGVYSTEHNIWAEIVNPTPKITINGYDANFGKDSVSFGCQTLPLEMVAKLVDLSEYGVTLVDKNGDSLTDKVKEIYNILYKQSN